MHTLLALLMPLSSTHSIRRRRSVLPFYFYAAQTPTAILSPIKFAHTREIRLSKLKTKSKLKLVLIV